MKHSLIVLSLSMMLVPFGLHAKVELPSVIGDNMVLQQCTDVALWGKAEPMSKVSVKLGWDGRKVTVRSGEDGKWFVRVRTPEAGGPYDIVISDGETVTLRDILVGEVWYCGGQSNMEYPMRGYFNVPVIGGMEKIIEAEPASQIRIFKAPTRLETAPVENSGGSWKKTDPESVAECSAVAYFFALRLRKALGVPVGIITDHVGGTPIQTWLSREVIERDFMDELKEDLEYQKNNWDGNIDLKTWPKGSSSLCFNGMVAPIVPYTFKGIIWYQGCSNVGEPELYKKMQSSYVSMMRTLFEVPDAPFCFAQIAPYPNRDEDAFRSGYFREAQHSSLKTIPGSHMITTIDLGEYDTIHPLRKEEVGFRFSLVALEKVYGMKGFSTDLAELKAVEFKDGKAFVTLTCDVRYEGVECPLRGFEIAGGDRVFRPAEAYVISPGVIRVSSVDVPEPAAVRYCYRNWCEGNVYCEYGMPLPTFRTDNWDDLKR